MVQPVSEDVRVDDGTRIDVNAGGDPASEALSRLALDLGAAPDLPSALRTLRTFIQHQNSLNGMFVSRYDRATQMRSCVYAFSEGEELDVSTFPPMPNTGSPHSRCVETGEIILTQDFQEAMAGKPRFNVGLEKDPRLPQSSLVVPMQAGGVILGAIELQSIEPKAFTPDHVATLQLAGHLAALTLDRVRTLVEEREKRGDLEARAAMLERRANERLSELASKNRELEAFSFTVAHDLRAPLRGILNLSEAIMKRDAAQLGERSRDDLAAVIRSSDRMARLVEDLLRFARTTQGSIRRSLVDMSTMSTEILRDLERTSVPARQVDVQVEPNLYVEADPTLVRILLDNLLGNAWKYTEGRKARIRVGAKIVGGEIVYFVEDNGVGFTPEQAKRVFLAFERLKPNQYEGTGVGLATAQRAVDRHGGRIWAEGEPNRGATFLFTLQSRKDTAPWPQTP